MVVRQQTNELEVASSRLAWPSHEKTYFGKQSPLLPIKRAAKAVNSPALAEAAVDQPHKRSPLTSKWSDLLVILKCRLSCPPCHEATAQTPCAFFIKQAYSANVWQALSLGFTTAKQLLSEYRLLYRIWGPTFPYTVLTHCFQMPALRLPDLNF